MGVVLRRRGPLREAIKDVRRSWRRWRASAHLISFPKCGRTWLVLLIATAIQEHFGVRVRNPLRLRSLHSATRGIPYIHQHHDGGPEFLLPEELERDKRQYAGRKVVFLVRDPRDVLVSSYFQKAKRNYNYEGQFSDYIYERRGGIESIVAFYNIWAENRGVPGDFLLVTYEDLQRDTPGELRRVLDFLGLGAVSNGTIANAVQACDFDNMRRMEAENTYGTGALSARDAADESTYKTRRGKVGGYREYLTGDDLAYVNRIIDERLDTLYERYRSPLD